MAAIVAYCLNVIWFAFALADFLSRFFSGEGILQAFVGPVFSPEQGFGNAYDGIIEIARPSAGVYNGGCAGLADTSRRDASHQATNQSSWPAA
jgi:hypothetical protein